MTSRLFSFVGGTQGLWKVTKINPVIGESLPMASRLDVVTGSLSELPRDTAWMLHGITSNERYVTRSEKEELVQRQPPLGREQATCAALIPIRKNANWWGLTPDERRHIFENKSSHIAIGMRALPAVARRLHHCRDLSENEPFDFLTWFEFAPSDTSAFDEMLVALRSSEEWTYVDREVDIRLERSA